MNLRTLTKRIFLLDAHYPRSMIASIILFTTFFLWKIPDLEIDPGLRSLVPADHKIVKNMELAEDLFSSNEIIIIYYTLHSYHQSNTSYSFDKVGMLFAQVA